MRIINKIADIQKYISDIKKNVAIGFVPTMGALHEGHFSLIRRSKRENKVTVVSIFVNPIQFGPKEDLARYPHPWKKDVAALKKEKVNVLFFPSPKDMYPPGFASQVAVKGVTETLCGSPQSRGPGHFIGVATVVAKLFALIRPDRAYFGLKDYQQLRVIETMNRDLNFGIQIVPCPTVRERDGLAVSSRNASLSEEERVKAPFLYHALQHGRKLLRSTPMIPPVRVRKKVRALLTSIPGSKLDYLELVDPKTLQKTSRRPILIAAALRLGRTRLIDNVVVR